MITLISGDPGAGKTAYVVSQLVDYVINNRSIYVMGIDELKLPHYSLPQLSEWTEVVSSPEDSSIKSINFTFESGSVVVIDEAQRVFRPRPAASKVPDYIAAFETHRHIGLDFILITQFPTLIDSNIRHLVSKHIHLRATWAGRQLLEWSEVSNPESRSDRSVAVTRNYSLPKSAFDLYKSATVHIKQSRRIPFVFYVFIFLVLVMLYLAYHYYGRIFNKSIHSSVDSESKALLQGKSLTEVQTSKSLTAMDTNNIKSISYTDFIPRINTRPETAPVYDEIRKPKQMPFVVGCVNSSKACRCYTSQATEAFLTIDQCREWLNHRPFNPWVEVSNKDDRVEIRDSGSKRGSRFKRDRTVSSP